jgi:CheY-like chemotaxis protein
MSANFRILVVDDDEDTAFAVGKALEALGYTVDAFADPEDALSSFKSGLYDLVLLDVLMKQMVSICTNV